MSWIKVIDGKLVESWVSWDMGYFLNKLSLELTESREKYSLLFQNMLQEVHIWELVRDSSGGIKSWRLIDANPTALRSWDKSLANIIGKTAEEIFPGSDAINIFMPIVQEMFAENIPITWERYFPGTDQYLSMVSVPLGDLFFSIGVDVSDLRRREEDLKLAHSLLLKSENLLKEMSRISKVGGWEFDIDTGEQWWTEEVHHILEVDLDYVPDVEEGINFYSESSRPVIKEAVQRAIEQGEPYDLDLELITAKGNLRYVRAIGTADLNNRIIYGTFQDVTEKREAEMALRESEELLRVTLTSIQDPVFITDNEGRYTFICPNVTNALGYTIEEINEMGNISKLVGDDLFDEEDLERQGSLVNIEKEVSGKDGVCRTFLITIKKVAIGGGTRLYTMRDITERKEIEKEILKLNETLKLKNSELESFVYTASHDLRSPLVTITGFCEMARETLDSGDMDNCHKSLDFISRASKRMEQLLKDLLDISRVGLHKHPKECVNLGVLIEKAVDSISGVFSNHKTTVEIEPDLPNVTVDRQGLLQVVENLLTNASKCSQSASGGSHVKVGVTRNAEEVTCYIKDNGIGIDPENLEKIFDLFEVLDPDSEGTGVGLAIVKRIIEAHGGRIWAESEGLGHGTTLFFTIPEA